MNKFAIAAALLGSTVATPALADSVVSENFNAGFGAFTVESTTIAIGTARPGYEICCGASGSDAALTNPFAVFGAGNVTNRGSIFTEFTTIAGLVYNLSFRAGAFGGGTTNLSYSVGGISGTLSLVANNNADTTFGTYRFSFTGTGSPTALSFSSRGTGTNIDPVLDDVNVSAVPEPASWGLMILGFGAMGYAMRRRVKGRTTLSAA